ncbi:MAG: MFS transporter [Acidobacteria bacterium]|nr:MFS transporter [Acidobacteriota bacterium]
MDAISRADRRKRTAAVVLAGFCAFLDLYAPQPLLPMLARHFQISAAGAGLVVSAATLAVALAAPFVGLIADRHGRKQVIVPATLLLVLPTLMAALAQSLGQLLFWRFLQGVLTPGIFAVTIAYINEEWKSDVGAAMAAYVTGTVLGGFTGRTLAALVATVTSWQWAFVWLAALNLAGGLAIKAWMPEGKRFRPVTQEGGHVAQILRHMRNPQLLATYAAGFCVLFSMVALFTYVNFHLEATPYHLSTAALGFLFTVYLVGAVITPIAGRWIDRLGHRTALCGALSLSLAGTALTLLAPLAAVIAGLAFCCTGVFIAQSAASSYIGRVTKEGRAAAVGLYVTFYYAGGSAGAVLPGALWSRWGWPACVALIALVQALTILLALVFWRPVASAPPQEAAVTVERGSL